MQPHDRMDSRLRGDDDVCRVETVWGGNYAGTEKACGNNPSS